MIADQKVIRKRCIEVFEDIEKTAKGHVFASRKGIVAATNTLARSYSFVLRSVGGLVMLERINNVSNSKEYEIPVQPDLQRRARAILDNL